MERFPRIPRWLGITVASASAALLVVGSAVIEDLNGWSLVAWLVLAAGFAAAAIGLPQLQQWQAEHDARLQLRVDFDPPQPVVPAFKPGVDSVLNAWRIRTKENCLASLSREQSPARNTAMDPWAYGEDDPLEGRSLGDMRRLGERQASGDQLTDDEARALEAFERTTAHLITNVNRSIVDLAARVMSEPDDRTPEQYRAQVDSYLSESEERIRGLLLWRYAQENIGQLHPSIINPTDRVFENVQLELYLPGNVLAFSLDRLYEPPNRIPHPPRPFGARKPFPEFGIHAATLASLGIRTPDLSFGGPEIDNSASARITFEPLTLRPRARAELDTLVVVVDEPTGTTVAGSWRATATNVSGRVEGQLEVHVADEPLDAARLAADLLADE